MASFFILSYQQIIYSCLNPVNIQVIILGTLPL